MADTPPATTPQTQEYDEHEDPEWLTAVFQLPKTVLPYKVRYSGACPNCLHQLWVDVPRPLDFAEEEAKPADKKPTTDFDGRCRCNCTEGHKVSTGTDAPPEGCGVYAYATIP